MIVSPQSSPDTHRKKGQRVTKLKNGSPTGHVGWFIDKMLLIPHEIASLPSGKLT